MGIWEVKSWSMCRTDLLNTRLSEGRTISDGFRRREPAFNVDCFLKKSLKIVKQFCASFYTDL